MKETLKTVKIDNMPCSAEEYSAFFQDAVATPEGAAAAFAVALKLFSGDREKGQRCFSKICVVSPDEKDYEQMFPRGEALATLADSYFSRGEDGCLFVTVKITNEKMVSRRCKTIYVGCNGTGSYRPITLVSKPPRFLKKRDGIRREYYDDPWLVSDYPSMLLPVVK